MNAAQRLLDSIGAYGPLCSVRDYRLVSITGTPKRWRWGKVRLPYRSLPITPERQLKYMHSHARRALSSAEREP
jgi:hypothetical protein